MSWIDDIEDEFGPLEERRANNKFQEMDADGCLILLLFFIFALLVLGILVTHCMTT